MSRYERCALDKSNGYVEEVRNDWDLWRLVEAEARGGQRFQHLQVGEVTCEWVMYSMS